MHKLSPHNCLFFCCQEAEETLKSQLQVNPSRIVDGGELGELDVEGDEDDEDEIVLEANQSRSNKPQGERPVRSDLANWIVLPLPLPLPLSLSLSLSLSALFQYIICLSLSLSV